MTNLYKQLLALTKHPSESFFLVEQVVGGHTYHIFSYRLASYNEFLLPEALNCRGTTFRIDPNGPVLVSLPPHKFFNLNENPFTMNVDPLSIVKVMEKLDGSLISTVVTPDGGYILKSKQSLQSEHCVAAERILLSDEYSGLRRYCAEQVAFGKCVNMEYCSPEHRIVIGHDKPMLRVLNTRNLTTGQYHFDGGEFAVKSHRFDDLSKFFEIARVLTGTEGFVCITQNGLWFKIKTEEYMALHRAKDDINSPSKLFEACLLARTDDLKAMFANDPATIDLIVRTEVVAKEGYQTISRIVRSFLDRNQHLSRKDFAILAQQDDQIKALGIFPLVMNAYIGRDLDINGFLVKNVDKFVV